MGPIELLVGALITVVAGVAAGYAMYFYPSAFFLNLGSLTERTNALWKPEEPTIRR